MSEPPECECFWTDPSTWLSAASCGYGSGYEPGSQMEWNPECPVHRPWTGRAGANMSEPKCPECTAGKHVNCTDTAYDGLLDEFGECGCRMCFPDDVYPVGASA